VSFRRQGQMSYGECAERLLTRRTAQVQSPQSSTHHWRTHIVVVMPLSPMVGDARYCGPYARATVNDDMERRERLAFALRAVMKERGLTQAELAQMLGRSEQTVRRWAGGLTVPSVLEIEPLAEALRVDPIYFVTPPEPQPYPVRDFLRELTAAAEEEGRARDRRQGRGPQNGVRHRAPQGKRRPPRSTEK